MGLGDPLRATATPHAALHQAAEWFALLRSGEASEQQRAAWRTWLDARREHHEAWRQVEHISGRFEPLQTGPQAGPDRAAAVAALQSVRSQRSSRRHMLSSFAAIAGSGLLGWAAWREFEGERLFAAWGADHHTATGEIRETRLADGSRTTLNTASALDVDFRPDLRRVVLRAGEVLIQTATDAARPFVLDTAAGRLRADDTRFSVRERGDRACVSVYEGRVEVRSADTGFSRVIGAGQQVRFSPHKIGSPAAADPAREAWSRGVLLAQDIPLKALVAELARYRHGHLGVAPEIADLRVLGGFPLRDPDKALAMLAAALPIRVQRTLPWWVTLEARR